MKILKQLLILFLILLFQSCATKYKLGMNKSNYKYGNIIELKINEDVTIDNSLLIKLTYFTHKRPRIGGSTQATATLIVTKDNTLGEINLSVRGIQGKSESEDGLSEEERFRPVLWKGYKFQLAERFGSNYGESIRVIILKDKKYN